MTTVTIEVTLDQAQAINKALESYSRICMGQLEHVAELARDATIPMCGAPFRDQRTMATVEACDEVDAHLRACKAILGYPSNGSNGIGHDHVDITARRAWEVKKVLSKAIAEHRDPSPKFRGVDYDGRIVRYTTDPDPVVRVAS